MTQSKVAARRPPRRAPREPIWVVGVGASAGGLEALREFVRALEPNGHIAYVVAQHLSPTHPSILPEILARETRLVVRELGGPVRPLADTIYVTPPNRHVEFRDRKLHVETPDHRVGPSPAVNRLFTSLALELEDHTAGVILSGTGSDGALGVRAIKAAGGITFAQDEGARYGGMPRAAVDTGCVDLVMPPQEIARRIAAMIMRGDGVVAGTVPTVQPAYEEIIALLRRETGIDFGDYRAATIQRRIARRIAIGHDASIESYRTRLAQSPEEVRLLARDVLIVVTSFFRDASAFTRLAQTMTRLVRAESEPELRIWVPACATGEEAYSIAFLALDAIRETGVRKRLRLFASDVDQGSIATARQGRYPLVAIQKVPSAIAERYIRINGEEAAVADEVREHLTFARHNVIQDPPFSRLDLVSCRNLFIYFDAELQRRVLDRFHYALRPGGVLFLGRSETIGDRSDLFQSVDRSARLFRRKSGRRAVALASPLPPTTILPLERARPRAAPARLARIADADRAIARALAPPTIIVDDNNRPLHVNGNIRPYLSLPNGPLDLDILGLVDPSLKGELRAMLLRARRDLVAIRSMTHRVEHDGDAWSYRIVVTPCTEGSDADSLLLVSFVASAAEADPAAAQPTDRGRTAELEHELTVLREHLRTMVSEIETTNEELQSLNEEMQTANEELQSTNEEMETTNEELQSTNEELTTVNEELLVKSEALNELNASLESIIESVADPILVTDRDGRLRRFNAAAADLLQVGRADIGAIVDTLKRRRGLPDLRRLIRLSVKEEKRQTHSVRLAGRHFALQVDPCIDSSSEASGAVLLFNDVTALTLSNAALKRSETELSRALARQRAIIDTMPPHIALLDRDGTIVAVNESWRQFARENGMADAEAAVGTSYLGTCGRSAEGGCAEASEAVEGIRGLLAGAAASFEMSYPCHAPDRERWFKMIAGAIGDGDGVGGAVVVHVDVTDRILNEQRMREAMEAATRADTAKTRFLANMSHELRTPLNAIIGFSEMMQRETYGPHASGKYMEYSRDINEAARHLLSIISEILDISKVESGTLQLRTELVDLRACAEAALRFVGPDAAAKKIALERRLEGPLPAVRGDPDRLKQMMTNVLGNAIKFTPPEGRVTLAIEQETGGALRVAISDSGRGIAPEDLPNVTRPFYQAERDDLVSGPTGVGLGLALVQSLARLHGADLAIDSTLGGGTTVSVRFPPPCLGEISP